MKHRFERRKMGLRTLFRSGGRFLGSVARRRLDPHSADEQVVERGPLLCAEGAEQVVFDHAEPGVGETEFLLALRCQLDDVSAAVSGIAPTNDQLALLKLGE